MILDVIELFGPFIPKLPEALLMNLSLYRISGRLDFIKDNIPALFVFGCLFLATVAKRNNERSRPLWPERI